MSERIRLTAAEAGQRFDRYLRKLLPSMPLGAIMKHVRSGRIRIDGGKVPPSLRLVDGMELELRLSDRDLAAVATARRTPDAEPTGPAGPRPRVVHEDDDVLIIHKPAGLAVHGGSGHGHHSVVAWLDREDRGTRTATFAPAPAHRLDRATSGLLAIGLTPQGLGGLTAAFRDDRVEKVYVAVVEGCPEPERGTIDAALRTVEAGGSGQPKVVVDVAGKPAVTDYRLLQRGRSSALLRLEPRTGRTHQLRAHLAHIGHPIAGDRRYGQVGGPRLLLHAMELRLPHPVTGEPMRFSDPMPAEFRRRTS